MRDAGDQREGMFSSEILLESRPCTKTSTYWCLV